MTPEQRSEIEAYVAGLDAPQHRWSTVGRSTYQAQVRLLLAEVDRQAGELERLRGVEQAARALVDCLPDSRREMDEVVRLRRDYVRQTLEESG